MILTDELIEAWAIEYHNSSTPAGTPYYKFMSFEVYVEMKTKTIERGCK